jgi:DNA polymerase-1
MYIPHCKDGWIVEADYSQIELRIVALLAGDEPLLDVFAAGGDPHSANAQDLFYPPGYQGQVTKRERTLAKNFVYLAMYGGNAKKLYTTILPDFPKFTLKKAQILLQNFFRAHPAINQWHADILQQAKNTGRVREPLSGRERVFWGPVNPNEALNYPVQTAAGHIINTAIQDVAKDLSWDDEGVLFQLHDALILDGRDPVRLAQLLIDRMDVPIELNGRKARFPVDVSVGKNWATTEEIDSADTQIVLERVRKLCYD